MKKSIFYVSLFSAALFASALITSCGTAQKQEAEQEQPAAEEQEPAAETAGEETAYACPMHPEVTGKEGDKCSKCGMDLEKVEAAADSTATGDEM